MTRIALILMFLASPAFGQSLNCGPRSTIVTNLMDKYGETVQGMGMARGIVVEMFASEKTGTWTITATRPDGILCIVASGRDYERSAVKPNL